MIKRKKTERKLFNDLLLPVICALCVLPFVVYLAEYDSGYSKYLWHSENSVMQDFYVYCRCRFLYVILFFMLLVLAFQFAVDRMYLKKEKLFICFAVYGIFAVMSCVFSVNHKASVFGNYVEFEGIFVLLGYGLLAFYTYQNVRVEQDFCSIYHAVEVMFIPASIVGWFQVGKHDLLNYEWMQKIVMSDSLYGRYGGEIEDTFSGNNVFLTLGNPNYAAVFLLMFSCIFLVKFISSKVRWERAVSLFFLSDSLILCWFTYTRAAFVAIATVILVLAFCRPRKNRKHIFKCIGAGSAFLLLLVIFDICFMDSKFLSRIVDEQKECAVKEMVTDERGVRVTYEKNIYWIFMDGTKISVYDTDGKVTELKYSAQGYRLPFGKNNYARVFELDGKNRMETVIDGSAMWFEKRNGSYYYCTEWGKQDRLVKISSVDFHGWEYLGSGRLYIWSRVIPMLKHYIFIGSGPDTFAEVFPQNDYVGKSIYAEYSGRVMERAHNDFLMRWVQTGLCSVVALIIFYVVFISRGWKYYHNCLLDSERKQIGFGCFLGCIAYLVCCFFSDSTLFTTPVFYVFVGIVLAGTETKPGIKEPKILIK